MSFSPTTDDLIYWYHQLFEYSYYGYTIFPTFKYSLLGLVETLHDFDQEYFR